MTFVVAAILAVVTVVFISYPFLRKWLGLVSPDESNQFSTDSELDAEIERQVTELRKHKVHHCPKCNTPFKKNDRLCPHCGTGLRKEDNN